jgi:hypothetical protein
MRSALKRIARDRNRVIMFRKFAIWQKVLDFELTLKWPQKCLTT